MISVFKTLPWKARIIIIYLAVFGITALIGAYYLNSQGGLPGVIMLLCISLISLIGCIVIPRESLREAKTEEFKAARKDQFHKLIRQDKSVVLFDGKEYQVLEFDIVEDKIEIQPIERPETPKLWVGIYNKQLVMS